MAGRPREFVDQLVVRLGLAEIAGLQRLMATGPWRHRSDAARAALRAAALRPDEPAADPRVVEALLAVGEQVRRLGVNVNQAVRAINSAPAPSTTVEANLRELVDLASDCSAAVTECRALIGAIRRGA